MSNDNMLEIIHEKCPFFYASLLETFVFIYKLVEDSSSKIQALQEVIRIEDKVHRNELEIILYDKVLQQLIQFCLVHLVSEFQKAYKNKERELVH
mmetsp:Transcript_10817/g.10943  ORF Transcript_10817/g.10943 Transcript_10817/m.10943 type:complete len:95 (+) Transcript_10817:31-315(+)